MPAETDRPACVLYILWVRGLVGVSPGRSSTNGEHAPRIGTRTKQVRKPRDVKETNSVRIERGLRLTEITPIAGAQQ